MTHEEYKTKVFAERPEVKAEYDKILAEEKRLKEVNRSMTKYILVPEYRPLFAMAKIFGPTHGPLQKPTAAPVEIIGQLLLQDGLEKVTVFEVGYDPTQRKTFGKPVQLTRANYMIPYEELIKDSMPDVKEDKVTTDNKAPEAVNPVTPTESEAAPVEPTVVNAVEEAPVTLNAAATTEKLPNLTATLTNETITVDLEPQKPVTVEIKDPSTVTVDLSTGPVVDVTVEAGVSSVEAEIEEETEEEEKEEAAPTTPATQQVKPRPNYPNNNKKKKRH